MRINNLEGEVQQIIFSEAGEVLFSDNTLFTIDRVKRQSIRKQFPFIESIFETLRALKPGAPPLHFSCIATKHKFLPGYYDFAFSKTVIKNQTGILWQIKDRTQFYHLKQKEQQIQVDARLSGKKAQKKLK
jgi:hypothetical protein